jgi:hypothetical protein
MLTLTIWRAAILLEAAIFYRGFRGNLLSKYPFFYTYIMGVLVSDTTFYVVYMLNRAAYVKWYWVSTTLVVILGYGIILEVFKHVLSAYPGVEKLARVTGLAIFAAIFCFAISYSLWAPEAATAGSKAADVRQDLWIFQATFQRDFWTVQAIFLFAIIGVVSYYKIPLGKNLKGMIVGYGLCLGATLVTLALRSYIGLSFDAAWVFLQPFSFDVSLSIWAATLWAFHPNPAPNPAIRLEADYEIFAAKTRGTIGAMRTYLGKAARS